MCSYYVVYVGLRVCISTICLFIILSLAYKLNKIAIGLFDMTNGKHPYTNNGVGIFLMVTSIGVHLQSPRNQKERDGEFYKGVGKAPTEDILLSACPFFNYPKIWD